MGHENWIKERVKNTDQQMQGLIAEAHLDQKAFANEVQARLAKINEKFENLKPVFPRRRLTPQEIEQRVQEGEDFRVADAGTGPVTSKTYIENSKWKASMDKEEMDKLSDTEKKKLKQNPDLWNWYLGA